MKPKKCRHCGKEFQPFRPLQRVCSPLCAVNLVNEEKKKASKRATRELKQKLKSRRDWEKDAQAAFNKFIRLRDHAEPCISCGRHHQGQYHAGHYKTVGSAPELRFEELNCHKQCSPCNNHLSGNIIEYRPRLIEKIGLDKVEWIEGPHEPKKYTIEDLKEIKAKYNKLARELEKSIAQ